MIKPSVIRTLRLALATLLLLAAGNALALGLGQIEVKSRINEPLLAEIPIVSTTPGELQALQARLASPETFRRVGLSPPQGIAADLRFSLGNDARGRPVIRVTTVAPVTQTVLNFLIEVDWGQGRLVREYSALIDAPRTASAPLQPAISAAVVAAPRVVQRPVVPTTPLAAPAPVVPAAVVRPVPPPMPVAELPAEPVPASTAIAPPPRKVVAAAPAPASASAQYGPIKAGETLSKIASGLDRPGAYNLEQTMLALLRANPDAFQGDNINLLRQGAVLRVPGTEERAAISAEEAQLVVREQMQQWRQARRPVIQPAATVAANVPTRSATPGKLVNDTAGKPVAAKPANTVKPAVIAKPAKPAQQAQARLEIVPAAVPGKATGTRSGTNAGGEGKMLQQQLQQRDEDLAARKAEISDLKERVAALEKLEQQQTQLLTMKDSELAAAQQRLADARKAATVAATTQPSPAAMQATQITQPMQAPQQDANNVMPWLWGGMAVVGLALLAWLFSRRRPASTTVSSPRRSFDSEALAASMRTPSAAVPVESDSGQDLSAAAADAASPPTVIEEEAGQIIELTELPTTPVAQGEAPTWHSGRRVNVDAVPDVATPAASTPRFVPSDAVLPTAPLPEPASAEQRMKLARAFLDIGDDHSARQLLLALMDGADPAMRTDAAMLLRELG
ncbi:MAG: FimV/HubP family polar landmark protein [Thermomonas sp.]